MAASNPREAHRKSEDDVKTATGGHEAACKYVARKFPLLADVRPTVTRAGQNDVYTFAQDVPVLPGGPKLRQVVRITVDAGGHILKVVMGR